MDWINVSSCTMTAVSLLIAAVQTYRTNRLKRRYREQLTTFITDADYVSFEHELLDELAPKIDDAMLQRYLVSLHQRGCDLYRGLVDYYLSQERRFTFNDLKRISQTPMMSYKWQEDFWRGRLAMRPENRKQQIPAERFLVENKSTRYKSYKERGHPAETPGSSPGA
jgi:hypothetical protein